MWLFCVPVSALMESPTHGQIRFPGRGGEGTERHIDFRSSGHPPAPYLVDRIKPEGSWAFEVSQSPP